MRVLIEQLPPYWHGVPEMRAIQEAIRLHLAEIAQESERIVTDTLIDTMSDERLQAWEKCLEITPEGTIEQRRLYLKSVLRGSGKLNESRIKSVVNALTGGTAIVNFVDSVITIRVLPPGNGEIYLFNDVERALASKIPAHLGLSVVRFYSTWEDIANDFASWNDVKDSFDSWQKVSDYIGLEGDEL